MSRKVCVCACVAVGTSTSDSSISIIQAQRVSGAGAVERSDMRQMVSAGCSVAGKLFLTRSNLSDINAFSLLVCLSL